MVTEKRRNEKYTLKIILVKDLTIQDDHKHIDFFHPSGSEKRRSRYKIIAIDYSTFEIKLFDQGI